jgi:putative membrane protein
MEVYNYIVVVHIFAILSWMTCLFYLPRLFVYHIENIDKQDYCDVVEVQEKKLYTFIGMPALATVLISGIALLYINPSLLQGAGFMHTKLLLAFFLMIFYFSNKVFINQLKEKTCTKTSKFFRIYNEIPTVLTIFILILIVIRPF